MQIVSVDLFIVPKESEEAFKEESNMVRDIIKNIPGLVDGYLYEKLNGDSEYNFITTAVWESEEAFENAGKRIWAAFQKQSFNPQEAHEKLHIKRIRSEYKRTVY